MRRDTSLRPRLRAAAVFTTLLAGLAAQLTSSAVAAPVTVGYRDDGYAGTTAPTAEKPQSKVWFNDGTWWTVQFRTTQAGPPATGNFYIVHLDPATQTWVKSDTDTLVETRSDVHIDTLSDGNTVYAAASSPSPTAARDRKVKIWGFTYDAAAKKYNRNAAFPASGVALADGEVETVTIDKDSAGTLWAAFVLNGQVMVSHSSAAPQTWVTSYVLPVGSAANVLPEPEGDEASLVRFDGNKVGIMFSNQAVADPTVDSTHMYWATHNDGAGDHTWTLSTAYSGIKAADDHINLKSLPAGDPAGKVFAAVKTSQTSPAQTLTHLLVLKGSTWTSFEFGKVSDDHTRPIVELDTENRKLYMFASSPCCNGGTIYYKQSSLDTISFPSGKGLPFIQSSSDNNINNPSSTKQTLNSATGVLVVAGDDVTDTYLHNFVAVPSAPLNVAAVPGNGSATVSWTSPASNGNSAITGYQVTATPSIPVVNVAGSATSALVSGLSNGTSYTFTVRAINAIGGTTSTPSNAVTAGPATTGGYVLDGYGGLHPFAVGDNPKPSAATGAPYWNGWDIARGVALLPNGTGGYVLDGYGGLHPFAVGNNPKPSAATGAPYWNGWDIAAGVALRAGGGGYVLDGWGGLHNFTPTGGSPPPSATGYPYWNGWNIARGVSTMLNGAGGYVLDGYGGVHPFAIGSNPVPPAASGYPYWNGWDIARDVAMR